MASSTRLNTPLGIRTRLNSLGQSKASSSSVLTLKGARNIPPPIKTSRSLPSDSDSNSESDDEAEKAEAEERRREEQEALDKVLKQLQTDLTSNAVGLVRDTRSKKGKEPQRGRDIRSPASPSPLRHSFRGNMRRDLSSSDLNSSTSSPQGSIPSIPSPPPESLSQSPVARHFSHTKSSSPPALSTGQARGQAHMQYRPMAVGMAHTSDRSSTQGSSASSFSDISGMSIYSLQLQPDLLLIFRVHKPICIRIGKCVAFKYPWDRFSSVSNNHIS